MQPNNYLLHTNHAEEKRKPNPVRFTKLIPSVVFVLLLLIVSCTEGTKAQSNGCTTLAFDAAYGVGATPWSITTGDFNGDGKPDLATPNSQSNDVSVLLGNGDGTFGSATNFEVGNDPFS